MSPPRPQEGGGDPRMGAGGGIMRDERPQEESLGWTFRPAVLPVLEVLDIALCNLHRAHTILLVWGSKTSSVL